MTCAAGTRINVLLVLAILSGLGVARAGEIRYSPYEYTLAGADAIVIGKQTGPIGKMTPRQLKALRDKGAAFDLWIPDDAEIPVSDFEVKRVIKGSCNAKQIRVCSGVHYVGGVRQECFTIQAGETAVLHLDGPSGTPPEWHILNCTGAMTVIVPKDAAEWETSLKGRLAGLREFRDSALKDMERFAPEAVKEARKLLPVVVKNANTAVHAFCIYPTDKIAVLTGLDAEPWASLKTADLRVLRALLILAYPDVYLGEVSAIAGYRAFGASAAEQKIPKAWFVQHFAHLKAPKDVAAFAETDPERVTKFFADFPYFSSHRDRVPAEKQKPDARTARTLELLINGEDPGLYALVMGPGWYFFRTYRARGSAAFGKLRMPWIKERILAWAKPDADRRLRKVALLVMHDNPGPWVRAWIEAERRRAEKGVLTDLAAPAAGLDDPDLLIDIWKQVVKEHVSEGRFCWWLRYVWYYHPKLAAFAIQRWKAKIKRAEKTKEKDPGCAARAYLEYYARHEAGETCWAGSKSLKTPAEAEAWLKRLTAQQK